MNNCGIYCLLNTINNKVYIGQAKDLTKRKNQHFTHIDIETSQLIDKSHIIGHIGIYKITNLKNGKVYIGQSVNVGQRIKGHINALNANRHKNQHLQNSWNKYGEYSFLFEIIQYCEEDELDYWERYFISFFDSMNPQKGYNKESGGNLNKHLSEETKKKISENHADVSGENNPMWGKTHSEEAKKKMSEAHKGENNPMWGKTHSEETKKKMSEAQNTTGFYRVIKENNSRYKQAFIWKYFFYDNKKQKKISSINLLELEEKVKAKNLPWEIIDEEKAQKSLELNAKYHNNEV